MSVRFSYFALWLTIASPAQASIFELFGAGPRGTATAGALTAAAEGGEAAFHNPAMLMAAPLAGAWVAATATQSRLFVNLQRPVCTGTYLTCQAQNPDGFSTRAATLPRDTLAWSAGWHYPLGGVLRNRMALGMALALPNGHIIRISGSDPQSPNFPLYEGMPERLAFLFALAGAVTDKVWAGVGVQVLATLNAAIDLRVNATNHTMDRANIAIGLQPQTGVVAGVVCAPSRLLRFGVSFRQHISLQYGIPSDVHLGDSALLGIALSHQALYTPDIFNFGTAWQPSELLKLSADLTWARWSTAPDPSPQVALDVQGPAVTAFGLQDIVDVGTDTKPIALGFRDTWSPAVAAQWQASPQWAVRAGYRYRPTPAPRATGPFKYLDSDTHIAAAGLSYRFGTLAPRLLAKLAQAGTQPHETPSAFHVDLGAQYQALNRRLAVAADPNDPVGPLEHGGGVWHANLGFGGSF